APEPPPAARRVRAESAPACPKNITKPGTPRLGQAAPPPDGSVGEAEAEIDRHTDEEDDDHQREQLLSVSEVARELELLTQRRLVGNDVDDLARHQAPPREGPALLEPAHVARQRGRQDDVPVEPQAPRPDHAPH